MRGDEDRGNIEKEEEEEQGGNTGTRMRGDEERGNTEKEQEEEQGVALRYRCDRCAAAVKLL